MKEQVYFYHEVIKEMLTNYMYGIYYQIVETSEHVLEHVLVCLACFLLHQKKVANHA